MTLSPTSSGFATRCKITPTMADYTTAVVQLCPYSQAGDGAPLWTGSYAVTGHPEDPSQLKLVIQLPTRYKTSPGNPFEPVPSGDTIHIVKNIVRSLCEVYPHKELITAVQVRADTVEFRFQTHVNEMVREIKGYLPTVKSLDLKAQHNYG